MVILMATLEIKFRAFREFGSYNMKLALAINWETK